MKKKKNITHIAQVRRLITLAIILLATPALFGQFLITGTITDENNGEPVAGIEVYFFAPGEGPLGGTISDQDGVYRFYTNLVEEDDDIHLQSWSFCSGHWETYNFFFTITAATTTFNFMVCSDEEPCRADFEYTINNLEATFTDLSQGPVYDYYWSFGDGSYSYATNPVHSYSVPGEYLVELFIGAENNCFDSKAMVITIGENFTISGTAYAGTTPLPRGEVLLFDVGQHISLLQNYELDTAGEFSFSIDPFRNYLLLVLPDIDPGIPHFPVYMPTYHGDVMQWQQSTPLVADKDIEIDINLQSYGEIFHGGGTITGQVTRNDKEVSEMPVFLKNEGGNIVDFSYPAADGSFAFNEIPVASYIIYPEKTGKETDPGFVSLTTENPSANGVRVVESENQVTVEYNVGVSTYVKNPTQVYPIPTNESLFINSTKEIVDVTVVSLSGCVVYHHTCNCKTLSINTMDLENGAYLMHVLYKDGQREAIRVLILH